MLLPVRRGRSSSRRMTSGAEPGSGKSRRIRRCSRVSPVVMVSSNSLARSSGSCSATQKALPVRRRRPRAVLSRSACRRIAEDGLSRAGKDRRIRLLVRCADRARRGDGAAGRGHPGAARRAGFGRGHRGRRHERPPGARVHARHPPRRAVLLRQPGERPHAVEVPCGRWRGVPHAAVRPRRDGGSGRPVPRSRPAGPWRTGRPGARSAWTTSSARGSALDGAGAAGGSSPRSSAPRRDAAAGVAG